MTKTGTSSCARELFTILFLLLCKGADWQNRALQFFIDAHSIISILKKGSSSPIEHSLAIRIDVITTHYNITIQYIWIPRRWNTASDMFSRFTDIDDYTLSPRALLNIISCFGIPAPNIDLFATTTNALCPTFHSRFYQVACSGINTLALNLNGMYAYAFPPVSAIARFLQHLLQFTVTTILICPVWEGSNYWRILCPDHYHTAPYVKGYHPLTAWGSNPDIRTGPIGHPSFLTKVHSRHQWKWAAFLIDTTNNFPPSRPVFCLNKHFGQRCRNCPCRSPPTKRSKTY